MWGVCGNRRRGRPCIRWKDQIEEALSSIGVTNWRRRARSRGAWKDVLRQADILNCFYQFAWNPNEFKFFFFYFFHRGLLYNQTVLVSFKFKLFFYFFSCYLRLMSKAIKIRFKERKKVKNFLAYATERINNNHKTKIVITI